MVTLEDQAKEIYTLEGYSTTKGYSVMRVIQGRQPALTFISKYLTQDGKQLSDRAKKTGGQWAEGADLALGNVTDFNTACNTREISVRRAWHPGCPGWEGL